MVSPTDEDRDRMFNEKPQSYGKSLKEYIRWMATTNASYRERLQDPDRRDRAIKELVSKWRKAQIDHTEYKEKSPDLYKQSIVKHASDWFGDKVADLMKEEGITPIKKEQKELPTYPTKKGGWFGDKTAHRKASKKGWKTRRTKTERRQRGAKKFLKKHKV